MNTDSLIREFEAAYSVPLPAALRGLIESRQFTQLDGRRIKVDGQSYTLRFMSDIGRRMGGLLDQAIRSAVTDRKGLEPVGFMEATTSDDEFGHEIAVFVRMNMNRPDEADPAPVYLISYRGYPFDDEMTDDDDFEDLQETFECHVRQISPSLESFIKGD